MESIILGAVLESMVRVLCEMKEIFNTSRVLGKFSVFKVLQKLLLTTFCEGE